MKLHQVRYFLAVCEALNFTRAAELCHVTQPSLTRAIQDLEHELGCTLFLRERGKVAMTPVGEAVRSELANVQHHVAAARATALGWTSGTAGQLRIGLSSAIGSVRIGSFLGSFQARHPGALLTMHRISEPDLHQVMAQAAFDLAFVVRPERSPAISYVQKIFTERALVLLPAAHRLAHRTAVPLAALAGERVLMNTTAPLAAQLTPALLALSERPRAVCHCEDNSWLPAMVAGGAGLAVAPEGLELPPEVVGRPLVEPSILQSVHIVACRAAHTSLLVRHLLAHAADIAEQSAEAAWAVRSIG